MPVVLVVPVEARGRELAYVLVPLALAIVGRRGVRTRSRWPTSKPNLTGPGRGARFNRSE